MVTKRSHVLKKTCSWKLQVCLSMCDLFVTTRHQRVKLSLVLLIIYHENVNRLKFVATHQLKNTRLLRNEIFMFFFFFFKKIASILFEKSNSNRCSLKIGFIYPNGAESRTCTTSKIIVNNGIHLKSRNTHYIKKL